MDLTDEQWKALEPLIGELPRRVERSRACAMRCTRQRHEKAGKAMPTPTWDAIDASAQRHFAFLTERGFVPDPEPPRKKVHRGGFRYIIYSSERWAVYLYLEYREGYYDVKLVPLEQGKPREVPFGYRTMWELKDYLTRILGIQDEEIARLRAWYGADRTLAELATVVFADEVFARYAALLARYLDVIVASPHPPVGKE